MHISLVKVATDFQYEAYHVTHLVKSGLKDHELMRTIRERDFTLVTNNAIDFPRKFSTSQFTRGW